MTDLDFLLDEYLATRRALGVRLVLPERLLKRFVTFATGHGDTAITRARALEWATAPREAQPAQWANRLGMVFRISRYASAVDPRHEVVPQGLLPYQYRRREPYIYSDAEIADLIGAARRLPGRTGLRPLTFATLLGLLAVTGMRTNEIHVLAVHMAKPNHRRQRGPPDPDQTVAEFAADTARLAGSIPSKRQPLPGTHKLCEGYLILSLFVEHHRAMREYANTESTVLH